MVCFTCGKPIAHLYEEYQNLVKKYETDIVLNGNSTTIEPQPEIGLHVNTPIYLALRDLHISRECCRRMFMCQKDMYMLIS